MNREYNEAGQENFDALHALFTDPHKPFFHIAKIESMCRAVREQNQQIHQHNFYSVYWILQGEAIHATRHVEYPVKAGTLFFVPPNIDHKMILDEDTTGYAILFNNIFLEMKNQRDSLLLKTPLFLNQQFKGMIIPDQTAIPVLNNMIGMLLNEMHEEKPFRDESLGTILKLFLLQSNRIWLEQNPDNDHPASNDDAEIIIRFKKLIDENFDERKEVSFYAAELQMNPSCLNEVSKRYTGITAGELIRNRILDETKKLLYATDMNTKEIAYHLGFNDPAYFSRFFRKYTRQTMTDFRKVTREKYIKTSV